VLATLVWQDIVGGISLEQHYPEIENGLLVCATELRTDNEIERFATVLEAALISELEVMEVTEVEGE